MSYYMEPYPKYFDSSNLIPEIPAFYNSIFEDGNNVKYRSIPVARTSATLETSSVLCENACGVKDLKNVGSIGRSNYYPNRNSILGSVSRFPKQRSQLETQLAIQPIQRKLYSDHGRIEKRGQVSLSEPTLIAKDRGDNIPFLDAYGDENFTVDDLGDGKKLQSKEQSVKACIYVKNRGKVYKSEVQAVNFQPSASDIFQDKSKKHNLNNEPHSNATLKRKNNSKFENENDEFEIAIFLTGIKNFSAGGQNRQPDVKMKQSKKEIRKGKTGKKKDDSRKIKGKVLENARKKYYVPSNMLKINQSNKGSCSRLTYTIRDSRKDLNFSSNESDSDYEYDEGENIVKRRPKLGLDRTPGSGKPGIKPGRNGNLGSGCKSTNDDGRNDHSKRISSNTSQCSDMYKFPKPKMSDEVLWERFEILFKNYATTHRHSGEVISKKISTTWMMNAGVVDEFLSEEAADRAFKNAAGAKITMNAQEYKAFLIMLSLRLKLPYYQIYRRMCGS